MAHKKGASSSRNGRDSNAQRLGVKRFGGQLVGAAAGPKINMIHYKNKTGYRRRLGHRQKYTQVRVTGIGASKAGAGSKKKG